MKRPDYYFGSNVLKGYFADTDEIVTYTDLQTEGDNANDLLRNATVGREDWNGNCLEAISIDDLNDRHYELAEKAIANFIRGRFTNGEGK